MSENRRGNLLQRTGLTAALLAVLLPVFYFLSFAPAIYVFGIGSASEATQANVIDFYRPLARVAPSALLRRTAQYAGLTETEAFFFVEALASDAVEVPGMDPDFFYTAPIKASGR